MKNPYAGSMTSPLHGFLGALGLGAIPSWQQQMMQNVPLRGVGIFEQMTNAMRQMRRDFDNAIFSLAPPDSPFLRRRVYGYWQFKNGKIAVLAGPDDLPTKLDDHGCEVTDGDAFYSAWDRQLGAFVSYPR